MPNLIKSLFNGRSSISGGLHLLSLLQAKVAAHGLVPQVVIYTRFDTKELLVNVNEVIRIEYELEG